MENLGSKNKRTGQEQKNKSNSAGCCFYKGKGKIGL